MTTKQLANAVGKIETHVQEFVDDHSADDYKESAKQHFDDFVADLKEHVTSLEEIVRKHFSAGTGSRGGAVGSPHRDDDGC